MTPEFAASEESLKETEALTASFLRGHAARRPLSEPRDGCYTPARDPVRHTSTWPHAYRPAGGCGLAGGRGGLGVGGLGVRPGPDLFPESPLGCDPMTLQDTVAARGTIADEKPHPGGLRTRVICLRASLRACTPRSLPTFYKSPQDG